MEIDYFSIFLLWCPLFYGLAKSYPSLSWLTIILSFLLLVGVSNGLYVENKIKFNRSSSSCLQVDNKETVNKDGYNLQNILDTPQSKTHAVKINNVSSFNYSVVLKITEEEDIALIEISL